MVFSKKSEKITANATLKDLNNIKMNSFNVRNNTNYQTLRAPQTNNARANKVNNLIAKFSDPFINYDVSNFHHQSNDIKNSKLAYTKQDTEFISLSTWPFHNNYVSSSKNKSIGNHIQTTSHHYTSPVYSSSRLPQFVTSHKSSTDSHENTLMNTSKTQLKNSNNHKQTESVNIIEVYDESKFGLAALRKNKSSMVKQTYNGNDSGVPLQDNTLYDDNSIIGLAALKKRNDCPISTRPNDIALNVPLLPNNSDSKRNSLNEDSDSNNNAVTPTPSTSSNFYVQTFKSTLNNNILFGKSRVGNIILNNSPYQSQDITVSERGKSDPTVHVQHINGEINDFLPQNDKNASIMTKASQLSGYTQESTYSSLNTKMCPPDKIMNHGKNDHIIATTADKTDNIGNENTPTSLHCRQASEDSTTSSFSSLLLIVSGGKPPPPQFTTQFNSAHTNDAQNKSFKLSPSNQGVGHETHLGNSIDNSLLYTTMITSSYSSSASTSSLLSSARDSNNSNDESSGNQKIHKVMPKPHAMPKTNNPNLDEVDNLCDSMAKKELKHSYQNHNDDNDSIIYIQNNLHKADSHTPNHAQRSSTLNGKQYMGSHSTPNAMTSANDNQEVDKILSPSLFEANAPPPLSPLSLTSPKLDIMEETQNKYSSFYNGLTHNGIKLSPLVTNCSPTQLNKNNINSGNAIKHNLFMMNKSSNTILTANYNNGSNQTTANNTFLNSNISRSESRGSIASLTSIVSLASSTSYLSPHELQQLIDEANLTIDHTGATDQIIEVIILHREHMGGGIGITLAGGIDQEQKEIRIHKVISGSVADKDGRAFKGDRVLSINGKTLFNLTHRQSVEILKAPRPEVVLVLSRSKLSRLGQQAMIEPTQISGIKLEKNDDAENYIFNKLSNMQQNGHGTESPINNNHNINSNNHSTFNNCDHLSSDSSERSCYQKLVFHQHINKNNSPIVTKLETRNDDKKDVNSIQNDSKSTHNNNNNIATQNKYENIVTKLNNQEEKVDKISSSITVELCNNSSALSCGSLGFSLEGGVASLEGDKPLTVKRIFKGGLIDRCGQNILPGYQLLCVNGEHLNGLTLFQAWNLIKNLPQGQNVSLTFLPKNPTNTNLNLPN